MPFAQTPGTGSESADKHSYAIGQTRLLACFVALNFLSILLTFTFVRETQGLIFKPQERALIYLSLEDLNKVFDVPTWEHFAYQCKVVTPFSFRWIQWVFSLCLPDPPQPPEEFFHWIREEADQREQRAGGRMLQQLTLRCRNCSGTEFSHIVDDGGNMLRCVQHGCGQNLHFTTQQSEENVPLMIDQDAIGA